MNIPREIDLSALLSTSEPFREFVIDPDEQVIYPRPSATGLYGLWTRFVAWFCRGNADRHDEAIRKGYLPITFRNGADGLEAKYLLEGLRSSLCDLPGFDQKVFDDAATSLRKGLGDPEKAPVALAKKLVERCIRGSSCDIDTMEATRKLVTRWLEGPRAKALGFDRTYKQQLIRLAIFSMNSEHLSGLDVTCEALAQRALETAVALVVKNRNEKNLENRISALPGDPSSPPMKSRIKQLAMAAMRESCANSAWRGDVLDQAIAKSYVDARAELLVEQLGIDHEWACEVAKVSLDLKTVGSVTLPYIPTFPSEKEADALLAQHNRAKLLASCCVVARRKLHADLDPSGHVADETERERRDIILAAELDTAVMVVRPNWAEHEAMLLSSQVAAKQSNVELATQLLAYRNDGAQVTKLDQALRFEKLSAQAGIEFETQRRITARLHVKGMLPVDSVPRFGAATQLAADLLILCATAPRGESSGQIFTALWEAREAIEQLLGKQESVHQAMSAESHQTLVQAVMQVAVIGLVRQHRGKPLLAKIVKAFASDKDSNRTQSIWRALRSRELAAKPQARELDRLFSMLIVEFGSELLKAEHQSTAPVGHGKSMKQLAADMHNAIGLALAAKGASLVLNRSDLRRAVDKNFRAPHGFTNPLRRLTPARSSGPRQPSL